MNNKIEAPSQRLAMAVVLQALQDLVRPTACNQDQMKAATRSAHEFIFSDTQVEDLRVWCAMAELNVDAVRARGREVIFSNIDLAELEREREARDAITATELAEDELEH